MKPKIYVGQNLGNLHVLSCLRRSFPSGQTQAYWVCRCTCGKVAAISQSKILSRGQDHCGCLRGQRIGKAKTSHGHTGTAIYRVWANMKNRCLNPKVKSFKDYGNRGITVCERWLLFENFLADMGEMPSPKHTLERKDNMQGYTPDNCVWATRLTQMRNTRANHLVTFDGQTRTISEWSIITGIKASTLQARLSRPHWTVGMALTRPVS